MEAHTSAFDSDCSDDQAYEQSRFGTKVGNADSYVQSARTVTGERRITVVVVK